MCYWPLSYLFKIGFKITGNAKTPSMRTCDQGQCGWCCIHFQRLQCRSILWFAQDIIVIRKWTGNKSHDPQFSRLLLASSTSLNYATEWGKTWMIQSTQRCHFLNSGCNLCTMNAMIYFWKQGQYTCKIFRRLVNVNVNWSIGAVYI